MTVITKYIFIVLTLVFTFLLAKQIFTMIFALDNYNLHKKRLKQLQFDDKKKLSDKEQNQEIINKVTNPVIKYIFPKLKLKNLDELNKDLKLSGWDKYFTPVKYRAMQVTLSIGGIIFGLLFYVISHSLIFGLIWLIALSGIFPLLFFGAVKEKRNNLLSQFPDFIRITQGYLTANVPFTKAVEQSIVFMGDEWKPLLQDFIVTCDVKSVGEAIEELQEKVNIFEVRELFSLIKLNLDQGIDIKDSFTRQADKVREMQLAIMSEKIFKRQTLCTMIQGPLLLVLILSFGLPVFSSMGNFSSI